MSDPILDELAAAGLKRVAQNEPMARHTSWRIGGPADYLGIAEIPEGMLRALQVAKDHSLPWLVLGGGNNILVADQGVEGLVILNRLRGISIEEGGQDAICICGAGTFFAKAAQYTARKGFSGLEWGIAIPGTVGGGVVNNAGAHASDVSRALVSATVVDAEARSEDLSPDDLAYRYRQSLLKRAHTIQSELIVTSCRFRLSRDKPESAMARVEELRQHRLRTQPVKEASAGSTFKNPEGAHAGALIDEAGLKGYRVGDAEIATKHANFILNRGRASAADVIQLIRETQERVHRLTGISLEPEVQFVGRWDPGTLKGVLGLAA